MDAGCHFDLPHERGEPKCPCIRLRSDLGLLLSLPQRLRARHLLLEDGDGNVRAVVKSLFRIFCQIHNRKTVLLALKGASVVD